MNGRDHTNGAATDMLEIVRGHIREGIRPVPIPYRQKGPVLDNWLSLVITEQNVGQYFNGSPSNVGAILGAPSGNLQDVDLDCSEAVTLAGLWLPDTRTFGRATNPTSHDLYRSPDLAGEGTRGFDDPIAKFLGHKSKLLELRSNGGQTVLPGSTHKDTGELITWDNPEVPIAECSRATLERTCAGIAAGCMLMRYWQPSAVDIFVSTLRAAEWSDEKIDAFLSPIAGTVNLDAPSIDPAAWREALALPRLAERAEEKERKAHEKARSDFFSKMIAWLGFPAPPPQPRASRATSRREGDRNLFARAQAYVDTMPEAISGSGGHAATFAVARKLVQDFGLNDTEAWTILLDYNARCRPAWSEKELQHKLDSARAAHTSHPVEDRPPPESFRRSAPRPEPAAAPEQVGDIPPPNEPTKAPAADQRAETEQEANGTNGAEANEQARRAVYDRLVEQARTQGYKPGWTAHQYRQIQGDWPPREWAESTKACFASDRAWVDAVERRQHEDQCHEPSDDGRLLVRIEPDLAPVYEQALAALRTVDDVFERGALVCVSPITDVEAEVLKKAGTPLRTGTPTIREMSTATLMLRLARAARWQKLNKKGTWVESRPDRDAIAALHDEGTYPGIPYLAGIAEAPFMRDGGTVCQTRGYDRESGYLYLPNAEYPSVDPEPTQEHAKESLDRLVDLFREFPFVGSAHIAVPVANILTVIGRPAIRGCVPAYLYDASNRGSGKTLEADTVSGVTTGRAAPRKDYPITRAFRDNAPNTDEEEMRKTLDGYAQMAVPLIFFDNVKEEVPFGGAVLEMALTTRDLRDIRVLGRNDANKRVPWFQTIMASGNNITVQPNTQRRVLRCRIETLDAHPEDRKGFKYKLPEDAMKLRPTLVADALTVLLAWQVAMRRGAKSELPPWDPFDEWVRVVAAAIVYAGGPNVLECRVREEVETDRSTEALVTLLVEIPKRFGRCGVTAKQVMEAAAWNPLLRTALGVLVCDDPDMIPSAQQLGRRLASAGITGTSQREPANEGSKRRTGRAIRTDKDETRRIVGQYNEPERAWYWSVEKRGSDGWQPV